MHADFSACSSIFESAYLFGYIVSFILGFVALVCTIRSEAEGNQAGHLYEVFSFIFVLFTDRHLEEKGKNWRKVYIWCVVVFLVLQIYGMIFSPCVP